MPCKHSYSDYITQFTTVTNVHMRSRTSDLGCRSWCNLLHDKYTQSTRSSRMGGGLATKSLFSPVFPAFSYCRAKVMTSLFICSATWPRSQAQADWEWCSVLFDGQGCTPVATSLTSSFIRCSRLRQHCWHCTCQLWSLQVTKRWQ